MVKSFWSIPRFLGSRLSRVWDLLRANERLAASCLLVLLLFLLGSGFRILKGKESMNIFAPVSRSDFDDYFQAARKLREGKDPYNLTRVKRMRRGKPDPSILNDPKKLLELKRSLSGFGSYIYPPFTAYVLGPLTYMEYESAAAVFQILSWASLLFFLFMLYRRAEGGLGDFAFPALIAVAVLYAFLLGNANNGNIGYFLILLGGGGLLLAWEKNIAWQILGGFLIGVAGMVKITPLFFGLILLGGRRYGAWAGGLLGIAFGLFLPAAGLGWEKNLLFFQKWYELLLETFGKYAAVRLWPNNQTLVAALGKLLVPFGDLPQEEYGLPLLFRSRSPSESEMIFLGNLVKSLNLVFYLLALGASVWVALRRAPAGEGRNDSRSPLADPTLARLSFLVLMVSLVASGVSWYHAYSVLLIPLFFRFYQIFTLGLPAPPLEAWALKGLAFFGFLQLVLPVDSRKALAMYSVFTFLILGLVFIYARLVFRKSAA